MFTVKLYKGKSIKLVCGEVVDVYPVGPQEDDTTEHKPSSSVMEIVVGEHSYYIADVSDGNIPSNFGKTTHFYDVAYIENAAGATTQTVKPY